MRLIVFSDDWGEHPSSCQHLVRRWVGRHSIVWVNSVGMRKPSLSFGDLRKAGRKLQRWTAGRPFPSRDPALEGCIRVIDPVHWPDFSRPWQQRLNARLIGHAVERELRRVRDRSAEGTVAITTLPIAAPLVDRLRVDSWVYYCVDDFSAWPRVDGGRMRSLEQELLARVDRIVAVSSVLQEDIRVAGREATLITHGVDLEHWASAAAVRRATDRAVDASSKRWRNRIRGAARPIALFWGLIDRRVDVPWLQALRDRLVEGGGSLILAGPLQDPDPAIRSLGRRVLAGPVPYDSLPLLASQADVLIAPYADSQVTRAMQPLKLKEYLATGKPVVARNLPAMREWGDAADLVDTPEEFVRLVCERARGGTPAHQILARQRLAEESWRRKAAEFEAVLLDRPLRPIGSPR